MKKATKRNTIWLIIIFIITIVCGYLSHEYKKASDNQISNTSKCGCGSDMVGFWYNYKTSEYDYREMPTNFSDYIPQYKAAQSLYDLYIKMGDTPRKAAEKVLLNIVK